MLASGSVDLIICNSPNNPNRSAGLSKTCSAGVWGMLEIGLDELLVLLGEGTPAVDVAGGRLVY